MRRFQQRRCRHQKPTAVAGGAGGTPARPFFVLNRCHRLRCLQESSIVAVVGFGGVRAGKLLGPGSRIAVQPGSPSNPPATRPRPRPARRRRQFAPAIPAALRRGASESSATWSGPSSASLAQIANGSSRLGATNSGASMRPLHVGIPESPGSHQPGLGFLERFGRMDRRPPTPAVSEMSGQQIARGPHRRDPPWNVRCGARPSSAVSASSTHLLKVVPQRSCPSEWTQAAVQKHGSSCWLGSGGSEDWGTASITYSPQAPGAS